MKGIILKQNKTTIKIYGVKCFGLSKSTTTITFNGFRRGHKPQALSNGRTSNNISFQIPTGSKYKLYEEIIPFTFFINVALSFGILVVTNQSNNKLMDMSSAILIIIIYHKVFIFHLLLHSFIAPHAHFNSTFHRFHFNFQHPSTIIISKLFILQFSKHHSLHRITHTGNILPFIFNSSSPS